MRSAAGFKRSVVVTLPKSGLEVELQKADVGRIVMENADTGDIPEPLVQQVMESIRPRKGRKGAPEGWTPERADMPNMSKFMDLVVRAAFCWPRIVQATPDYEAGEILITDLEPEDRAWAFEWAMPEGLAAAQSFRRQQETDVAATPVLQDVSAEPG